MVALGHIQSGPSERRCTQRDGAPSLGFYSLCHFSFQWGKEVLSVNKNDPYY